MSVTKEKREKWRKKAEIICAGHWLTDQTQTYASRMIAILDTLESAEAECDVLVKAISVNTLEIGCENACPISPPCKKYSDEEKCKKLIRAWAREQAAKKEATK